MNVTISPVKNARTAKANAYNPYKKYFNYLTPFHNRDMDALFKTSNRFIRINNYDARQIDILSCDNTTLHDIKNEQKIETFCPVKYER